jgi:hypothetical protein
MNFAINFIALLIAERARSVIHASIMAGFALAFLTTSCVVSALFLLFFDFDWPPDLGALIPWLILGLMEIFWYAGNAGRAISLHVFAVALVNPDRVPVSRLREILREMTPPLDEMVAMAYTSEDMPALILAAQRKIGLPSTPQDRVENHANMR